MLPYAEFCYNNSIHSSYKMTPFDINFAFHPEDNYPSKVMDSIVAAAKRYILKLKRFRKGMQDTLMLTKRVMAKYYNESVADHAPKFKVVDKVIVNGNNIKAIRPIKKLDHKIHGLFKFEFLVGPYAC